MQKARPDAFSGRGFNFFLSAHEPANLTGLANPFSNTVIVDDLFGNFVPTKNGRHYIRIEFWDLTANVIYNSNTVAFNADKIYPDVDIVITSGTGDCGDFAPGDTISGTYSIIDNYCHSMPISITSAAEAAGSVVSIDGTVTSSLSYGGGTLPGTGQSGTWQIQTPATIKPCGYNVWISGNDRDNCAQQRILSSQPACKRFLYRLTP